MHADYLISRAVDPPIKRVLVTGGSGYIGSALVPKLLAQGYVVRLLDKFIYGVDPLAGVINHERLEIIRGDFRHVGVVIEAMKQVDAVIHLGGLVGDPACAQDDRYTIEINLEATHIIAEVAKAFGVVRFIFASTCSVYGASNQILNETSALNPVSLYARTKIAGEHLLKGTADDRFTPIFLRFGTLYGFSGRNRFDLVVNIMTATALIDGVINVFGGNQWRPFVHVDDAALAVATALNAPLAQVGHQTFNVGSNEQNYRIYEIAHIVHQLVPHSQLNIQEASTDQRNYQVDFSKIHQGLGFVPHWSVENGVQQMINAFESGHISNYKDPRYHNARFLQQQNLIEDYTNTWAFELLKQTVNGSYNLHLPPSRQRNGQNRALHYQAQR